MGPISTAISIKNIFIYKFLMFTRFQQDHFNLALEDLFDRFTPKIPKHLYNVNFVPVVDQDEKDFKPDNWIQVRYDLGSIS